MSESSSQEFGKWRSRLWPIHSYELKKVLPLFFMFFCISFVYTILRDAKDAITVAGSASGSEVIPFLKLYGTVPAAIVFMVMYSKASNILSKPKLFYASILPFIAFFVLYPVLIAPYRDILHPTTSADAFQALLPNGLRGLADCYRNWTGSLFYIIAELWGSVALSLLFWGFVNDIAKVSEAKRFYAVLGIGANVALMCSGPYIVLVTAMKESMADPQAAWMLSLYMLMGMATLMGLAVMGVYKWMQNNVLTDPRLYDVTQVKQKKSKPKLGLVESFKFLLTSKYILCLAMMVIGYGISINLVEVTWKGQLKQYCPDEISYMNFMGKFSFVTGLVTVFMMLFVGGNSMRTMGWRFTALITPVALVATGAVFFLLVINKETVSSSFAISTAAVLSLSVMVGAAQNIMSKSCKYSCFDPAKEIAFIPMDQETKVKGKAAVDVVGARLGKSGGALLQQVLFGLCGGLAGAVPFIGIILAVVSVGWFMSVNSLAKQYAAATGEDDKTATESKEATAAAAVTAKAEPAGAAAS